MTIQSTDNLISALSAGQTARYDFNKVTGSAAYTAGRAYDITTLGALPVANTYPGTALVAQTCQDLTGNGTDIFGIQHG